MAIDDFLKEWNITLSRGKLAPKENSTLKITREKGCIRLHPSDDFSEGDWANSRFVYDEETGWLDGEVCYPARFAVYEAFMYINGGGELRCRINPGQAPGGDYGGNDGGSGGN